MSVVHGLELDCTQFHGNAVRMRSITLEAMRAFAKERCATGQTSTHYALLDDRPLGPFTNCLYEMLEFIEVQARHISLYGS
jgi:hypothetical protein